MTGLFSQQNLILLVGILLLASPVIAKAATLWVSSLIWKNTQKRDFEMETVQKLMELRNALEREGARNAASICRDLTFAVIYGESEKK